MNSSEQSTDIALETRLRKRGIREPANVHICKTGTSKSLTFCLKMLQQLIDCKVVAD